MDRSLTEQKVLKKLGIPDFRHVTKEKVMDFASLLDRMDPQVAMKAIQQFPDFAKTTLSALEEYKSVMDKTLDANDKSTQRCYDIYDEVISALKTCATKDDIPFEEKRYYIESMKEVAQIAGAKDNDNKKFQWGIIGIGALAVLSAIGVTASALGVEFNIKLPGDKS